MYCNNYSPTSDFMEETTMTQERSSCAAVLPLQMDVKPSICSHGYAMEMCTMPDCGAQEVSKILHNLQNFENIEHTSPLATTDTIFDFGLAQPPTSPSQWEDFMFELVPNTSTTTVPSSVTHNPADLGSPFPPTLPQCAGTTTAGAMLLQEGGQRRASDSPGPAPGFQQHDALLGRRDRHPSRSSLSEGYSTDHSAPSPAPSSHTGSSSRRQLTHAEVEKKERRKEQNRRAAKKCRIKKRALNETIQIEHKQLENENTNLKQEIQNLRKRELEFKKVLQAHLVAGCKLRPQPD